MVSKASISPNDFCLPDLGEGLEDAELIEWSVHVGQRVEENQTLAKMETAKALVEVPSPRGGTIAELHGKPGETIKVGSPLVTYQIESRPTAMGASKPAAVSSPAPTATSTAISGAASSHGNGVEGAGVADERADAGTVVGDLGSDPDQAGKVRAAPAVRRLARERGVELQNIAGTGIGGRITIADVEAASDAPPSCTEGNSGATASRIEGKSDTSGSRIEGNSGATASRIEGKSDTSGARIESDSGAPASRSDADSEPRATRNEGKSDAPASRMKTGYPARASRVNAIAPASGSRLKHGVDVTSGTTAAPSADGNGKRIPFRGVRRTIAEHLRRSVDQAIHYTVMDEADVSSLDELRRRLMAASNEKISFLPFVSFAICRVLSGKLGEHLRILNATLDEQNQDIMLHSSVHLGIATETDTGLMVPVIRDAGRMGVLEISRHIARIARASRERTIPAGELHGSTFTISNFGAMGGRFGTPIINYPESAILAVGRAREGVVVRRGMLGVGKLLPLSLSCDHRVIDGATAATALSKIIDLLQSPDELLPAV